MSLEIIIGGLAAFLATIFGAFKVGKSSGKKDSKIDGLKAENELRAKYEEISNKPDVDQPLDHL